jgi:hypothetical protein
MQEEAMSGMLFWSIAPGVKMQSKNKNKKNKTKPKPGPWSWKRFYVFWLLFTIGFSLMEKIGYNKSTGTFSPMSWGEVLYLFPISILIGALMVVSTGVARGKRKEDIYAEIYKKIERDNP